MPEADVFDIVVDDSEGFYAVTFALSGLFGGVLSICTTACTRTACEAYKGDNGDEKQHLSVEQLLTHSGFAPESNRLRTAVSVYEGLLAVTYAEALSTVVRVTLCFLDHLLVALHFLHVFLMFILGLLLPVVVVRRDGVSRGRPDGEGNEAPEGEHDKDEFSYHKSLVPVVGGVTPAVGTVFHLLGERETIIGSHVDCLALL